MEKLMVPTIHRNGTSADDLMEDNRNAAHSLREAIRKLQAAGPNGRDYYTQNAGAINVATEQHESRLNRLQSVLSELDQIAEAICNAQLERSR